MAEEHEVVVCAHAPACEGDHHGWSCPLSDPMGDVLRTMMDPLPNPVLEEGRQAFVFGMLSVKEKP